MNRKLTCIECPISCALSVDIEDCRVIKVSGNKCPKGETYAVSEIESPLRVLTSCVLTQGLSLKMIPVRTDKPIPKDKLKEAMVEVKRTKIGRDVSVGEIIIENFLDLGVNLVATRGTI